MGVFASHGRICLEQLESEIALQLMAARAEEDLNESLALTARWVAFEPRLGNLASTCVDASPLPRPSTQDPKLVITWKGIILPCFLVGGKQNFVLDVLVEAFCPVTAPSIINVSQKLHRLCEARASCVALLCTHATRSPRPALRNLRASLIVNDRCFNFTL